MNGTTVKYYAVKVELNQHTGEFSIDIEIREYWYEIKAFVETIKGRKQSVLRCVRCDNLIECRAYEHNEGVRWSTDNEYEAVCMAALVEEGFKAGIEVINNNQDFAVDQFEYVTRAHIPALAMEY